ncbi:hypothetical protein ACHAXS_009442 [Conticribra weissflogii]
MPHAIPSTLASEISPRLHRQYTQVDSSNLIFIFYLSDDIKNRNQRIKLQKPKNILCTLLYTSKKPEKKNNFTSTTLGSSSIMHRTAMKSVAHNQ